MPTKRNFLELQSIRQTWNEINEIVLSKTERMEYKAKKRAVDLYIDGMSPKQISELTGIRQPEIIRLFHKCMTTNSQNQYAGYVALIKNKKVRPRVGKIEQLFRIYPFLRLFVERNYFGDRHYTLEHNMNIRTLHTKFLNECRRLGIQDYDFPFSSRDKGYCTLNNYIKKLKDKNPNKTIDKENKNTAQKFLSTGFGESNRLIPIVPYHIVQIDGHKIDMLYTVEVENELGEIVDMIATRMWLIAVIDVATRVIIGYSLSTNENYTQTDVLNAIKNAIQPHQRLEFKKHRFDYPEDGGFPSEAIPKAKWAVFDTVMLDNAKSHLSHNVVKKLTEDLKCAVNFGAVATPETRGIIERFFRTLETSGFHRIPSTTGSNMQDTKRKNPEKECVKYQITYEDIEEMMEYFIADYNNSSHSALENQTPLQVMKSKIEHAGMKPCIIATSDRDSIDKLTNFLVDRTIRGGYRSGKQPHISYMGVTYHAFETPLDMALIGQKVSVEINPEDISMVAIYDEDGIKLGTLIASGEWGRYPHSLKTRELALKRKNANKESNQSFMPSLIELEEDLKLKAKESRRVRTTAANIRRESKKSTIPSENNQPVIKNPNRNQGLTEEQERLLEIMSIEEAFEKGVIG